MPRVEKTIATARAKADAKKVLNAMQRREELLGLVATYRRLKAELGLMDFSDQIALAARLADEHPEVGETERSKFRIVRSEEHTSELRSLMRNSYAVFCLKKKTTQISNTNQQL